MNSKHTNWYKNAVIYQIYPRSFCDSNGDGIGDIPGIISKLDYLKELGVNCVWLSPVYDSPQKDNGYDIANYREIYKPFGTLDDFKEMLKGMHDRGIKLIMDLVVNHTSDQHEWFKQAVENPKSCYRDYYIIRKGKVRKNGKVLPPNNWTGFFGEKAWSRIGETNDFYLHLFTKEQPDLNWESPIVRKEVVDILRYWLDMGVDGFRCDVINLISKKQNFRSRLPNIALVGKDAYINGPRLHEYLHLLYEQAYKDYDCMTVGECVMCNLRNTIKLIKPEREELDMIFNFSHTDVDNYFGVKYLYRDFSLIRFKKRLTKYQKALANGKGWNSLFIENHDQRRSAGRFGTDLKEFRNESAKSLATCYFLLCGTPFIYEGQEIGMTNADYKSINDYQDVELKNMYQKCQESKFFNRLIGKHMFEVSRDNARTPMQWDDSKFAGFSSTKPWLKVNKNKSYINVKDSIKNPDSIFHYYQKLIEFRKTHSAIIEGKYKIIHKRDKNVFSYLREDQNESILIICSFTNKTIENPCLKDMEGYEFALGNYIIKDRLNLKPYECRIYVKNYKANKN